MVRVGAAALRKRIERLAKTPDDSPLELAQALAAARVLPGPPEGDQPSIAELMELTGLSRRAIGYLIKVWERFGDLDIPRDSLVKIGWTKLAVVAENCAPGEELDALNLAEMHIAKDLPHILKDGSNPARRRTVLLRFTESGYRAFEAALLAHGAKRPRGRKNAKGLAGKERALLRALAQHRP